MKSARHCFTLFCSGTVPDNEHLCQLESVLEAGLDIYPTIGGRGFKISWLYEESKAISFIGGSLAGGAWDKRNECFAPTGYRYLALGDDVSLY